MDDITWKDQGTPADHARNVDTIATLVAGMGLYNVASELAVAAQCLSDLAQAYDQEDES